MANKTCIHSPVCKYANGMYCTGEKCNHFCDETEMEKGIIQNFINKLQRRREFFSKGGSSWYEAVSWYEIYNLSQDYGLHLKGDD